MQSKLYSAEHEDVRLCPDLTVAQRAPVCVLISGPRHASWQAARQIARGCGSGLSWIDCDSADADEMSELLREQIVPNAVGTFGRILFLREVQSLSPRNQTLLSDLIVSQRPVRLRPRLIASSSLPLYERVRAGLFDESLFYRLNAVHIAL